MSYDCNLGVISHRVVPWYNPRQELSDRIQQERAEAAVKLSLTSAVLQLLHDTFVSPLLKS